MSAGKWLRHRELEALTISQRWFLPKMIIRMNPVNTVWNGFEDMGIGKKQFHVITRKWFDPYKLPRPLRAQENIGIKRIEFMLPLNSWLQWCDHRLSLRHGKYLISELEFVSNKWFQDLCHLKRGPSGTQKALFFKVVLMDAKFRRQNRFADGISGKNSENS